METGFKVFRRESIAPIWPKLTNNGFAIEPEITDRVARASLRVYEVPVSYSGRSFAEGKKSACATDWKPCGALCGMDCFTRLCPAIRSATRERSWNSKSFSMKNKVGDV